MLLGDEPLGEGSFGLVWRCQSRRCDGDAAGGSEERAAKRITRGRLAARDVRNLFGDGHLEGEIKMHQSLQHPHIVGLYEVFEDNDVVSLVMECCNGGDLFDLIASHSQQGGLAEHCAARVQVHLLSALRFLHEHPIVHRDVKCENVLLAKKGTVYGKLPSCHHESQTTSFQSPRSFDIRNPKISLNNKKPFPIQSQSTCHRNALMRTRTLLILFCTSSSPSSCCSSAAHATATLSPNFLCLMFCSRHPPRAERLQTLRLWLRSSAETTILSAHHTHGIT